MCVFYQSILTQLKLCLCTTAGLPINLLKIDKIFQGLVCFRLHCVFYCLCDRQVNSASPCHCLLPYVQCLLPYVRYLLPYIQYLLPYVQCHLPCVQCLLPYVQCLLPYVQCLLPCVQCLLPCVQYLLPCAQYFFPCVRLNDTFQTLAHTDDAAWDVSTSYICTHTHTHTHTHTDGHWRGRCQGH